VGREGAALHTGDGGQTWQPVHNGTLFNQIGVAVTRQGRRIISVAAGGAVLTSDTWGSSWLSSRSSHEPEGVAFAADGRHGYIVGSDGIWTTADGGANWVQRVSSPGNALVRGLFNAVTVPNMTKEGRLGWAVGDRGRITATSTRGETWVEQTSGTEAQLRGVVFEADGLRGWAVGDAGTIVATHDGGAHWAAQSSGTRANLWSVAVTPDAKRVWAVGEQGTLLSSRDGGASWKTDKTGIRANLRSVSWAADGEHAWVVGAHRTMLQTNDAGATWSPVDLDRRPFPWVYAVVAVLLALGGTVVITWRRFRQSMRARRASSDAT
jgi:photosystem II stability/assembly factor-like uncharacterized protein